MTEFQDELTSLAVHIRTLGKQRLQQNKDLERADPSVKILLQEIQQAKDEGRLLDAVSLDRDAYRRCCAMVVSELFPPA